MYSSYFRCGNDNLAPSNQPMRVIVNKANEIEVSLFKDEVEEHIILYRSDEKKSVLFGSVHRKLDSTIWI